MPSFCFEQLSTLVSLVDSGNNVIIFPFHTRNLSNQHNSCDNDHELYMINDDIYPAMQMCTVPCTEVTFLPSVVAYLNRETEMEHTCEENYVMQIVFKENARVGKVNILRIVIDDYKV